MKRYAKKLAIVLSLVMILTSFGFTGAFANGNEEPVTDQIGTEAESATAPADNAPAADPAESEAESATAPADNAPAADPIETKAGTGAVVDVPLENAPEADDADPSASLTDQQPDPTGTFTVTWVNDDDTELEKDENVAAGTMPAFDGEDPVCSKQDEEIKYEFAGWTPEVAEVTEDVTYKAVYKSLNGKPAKPSVKTYSSYNRVRLGWKKITKDVNGFTYADSVTVKYRVKPVTKAIKSQTQDSTKTSYATKKNLDPLKTYEFKVEAYIVADGEEVAKSGAVTKSDSPVRPMRYKLTIKQGGTIKAHNTGKAKTLSSGQVIYADRFQTGRYIFNEGKNVFWVSRTRIGGKSAEYTTKWNYTDKEMQYYVNDRGVKSKTKYLIMVNSYTQHLYIFKGTKSGTKYKNWEIFTNEKKRSSKKYGKEKTLAKGAVMDWEVGTGTASDPTPTGEKGLKETKPWLKSRHSIPWWTSFNGTASLHGDKYARNDEAKDMGKPVSSGCIRNPHERAHWIFDLCKKGTQLVIF